MKKLTLLLLIILANNHLFSQEADYNLKIEIKGDTCFVQVSNNTLKTIEIENPDIYRGNLFFASDNWNFTINDIANTSANCLSSRYFTNITVDVRKVKQKIKRGKTFSFYFLLRSEMIECIDNEKEVLYIPKLIRMQLSLKLIKPAGIEIKSDIIDLALSK